MRSKFLVLFHLSLFHLISCSQASLYNAMFGFGDSVTDTGNTLEAGLPYGMTFFGHSTGRRCDGRLVVDFIAEAIGLPLLPPSTAQNQSFAQGANFAYAAAAALELDYFVERNDLTAKWVNASSGIQISWFEQMLPSLCGEPRACKDYLSKSLFVFGPFGGNDYRYPIYSGKSMLELLSYVPAVVKAISDGVERLIAHGAVDIVVPGLLPNGCLPRYLTAFPSSDSDGYTEIGCLKELNEFTTYHESALQEALARLQSKYPMTRIIYADLYTPTLEFDANPERYGFEVSVIACCGAGGKYNYKPHTECGDPGTTVCSDPTTYVNWDHNHLTEAAYHIIADGWLHGPYAHPPILNAHKELIFVADN